MLIHPLCVVRQHVAVALTLVTLLMLAIVRTELGAFVADCIYTTSGQLLRTPDLPPPSESAYCGDCVSGSFH